MSPALAAQLALLPDYLSRHLLLSVTALAIGIALSLPLGLTLTRVTRIRGPVLMVASAVQTIPGLALLALMVPLLRQIGFLPAVIALILYSMLPVLRNTVTGIEGVDANLLEAGRGLGMTDKQILFRVQLPIAMPVIIAGIRTATVWVVGMATLSTPVGATSLGNYIFSGLQTQNYTAVLVGCVAAAALALTLDAMIRIIEVTARRHRRGQTAAAVLVVLALIGGGLWPVVSSRARSVAGPEAVIGAKTFTEQYILSRTIASVLESAGFGVRTLDGLGSTVAFDALVSGRIDAYVDYTGTIWANYMHEVGNPGRAQILEQVSGWLDREKGVAIAARLGFENTYALAMTDAQAASLGVASIEDLVPYAPTLTMGADYEFFGRPEWAALRAAYGLDFAELVTMDPTLMYSGVAQGKVDVVSAFSTDGRISAFKLRVLADTRGALPPYDAVLLVRKDAPGTLKAALAAFDGAFDDDAMRQANRVVDLDGGTVDQAARGLVAIVEAR